MPRPCNPESKAVLPYFRIHCVPASKFGGSRQGGAESEGSDAVRSAAGTELVWHIEFTRSWWAAALPVASLIRLVIGRCVRNLERAAARGAEKEGGGGK